MKKFARLLSSIFAMIAAVSVCAAEPENFLPENANAIMRFNARRALKCAQNDRDFLATAEGEKFQKIMSNLQLLFGMQPAEVFASDVWSSEFACMDDMSFGAFFKTAIPEIQFSTLVQLAILKNPNGELSVSEINGKKVYILTTETPEGPEAVALTYVASDVVLLTRYDNNTAAVITESLKQHPANPQIKNIDRKALAAVVIVTKNIEEASEIGNVDYFKFTFDLIGSNQQDIVMNAELTCPDKNTARNLAMQAQMVLPSLICLPFGNDEELALTLAEAFKVKANDNTVVVNYALTRPYIVKTINYLTDPANRAEFNPQESVEP